MSLATFSDRKFLLRRVLRLSRVVLLIKNASSDWDRVGLAHPKFTFHTDSLNLTANIVGILFSNHAIMDYPIQI